MDKDNVLDSSQFWRSIKVWIRNAHVVNRRLTGITQVINYKINEDNRCFHSLTQNSLKLTYDMLEKSGCQSIFNRINSSCHLNVSLTSYEDFESNHDMLQIRADDYPIYLFLQKLLTKGHRYKNTFRICLLNISSSLAVFINISQNMEGIDCAPDVPYVIKLQEGKIVIEDISGLNIQSKMTWLTQKLLPRLNKWAIQEVNKTGCVEGSHNLIDLDKYNKKYQELKLKYGQKMVKIWPENTDPSKFVYEDVAIATYLLLLWEDERELLGLDSKQSFVDLGCGNGLLVYILNSEGHPGYGVDVRKRGIWDLYPNYVQLKVEPVTPSGNCFYQETDWLIGNHSDELTPWIPVLAARSSYNCRFFLLPCCAFEFDGRKYQRHDSSKSQYTEYLEYVKDICNACCINTQTDRLKIPSTKRICFVGTNRLYKRDEHFLKIADLQKFVNTRMKYDNKNKTGSPSNDQWVPDFVVRENVERVRNCTKIEKTLVQDIVLLVATNLLQVQNYTENNWNAGGRLALNEVVKLISPEKLKQLKKECGGLQTLLRNNSDIFNVEAGSVMLRHPRTKEEVLERLTTLKSKGGQKNRKDFELSQKPCWFKFNHPDGCPLNSEVCSYSHV